MDLDISLQCIKGYEWPKEFLLDDDFFNSAIKKIDQAEFKRVTKSFSKSIPVILTFLSKEYLSVGKIWMSMLKQNGIKQYLIIAADEESKKYLDSINQPSCRVLISESNKLGNEYKSRTGFTEKGLRITSLKFPLVKELLELSFNVLLMDIDALLLAPLPFEYFSNIDIAFQRILFLPEPIANVWGFAACSGFVWCQSNHQTKTVINSAIAVQRKTYDDQIALNVALYESNISWLNLEQDYVVSAKMEFSEREKLFTSNGKNIIKGIGKETGIKVVALSPQKYWRNDCVPYELENVILFHPNSKKSDIDKLEVFKNYQPFKNLIQNEI
jgi:hypothetical protein